MQSESQSRKNRMDKIRNSLKTNNLIKKNSLKVMSAIERRRSSLCMNPDDLKQSEELEIENSVNSYSKFNEKYQLGEIIGEGSNGLVKKCYTKQGNEEYAVKKIVMDDEHILFLKKNFKDIRELNHPNIIKYKEMYLDLKKNVCFLVMEYCSEQNLEKIKLQGELEIKQVMYQLFCTLEYIHKQGICHRDIKPENILFDRKSKKIKVIDFGISKKIRERGVKRQMLTNTGTLYYRAPEILNGGGYDEKVDLWAAGCTLYYLLAHYTPFESEYHSTTIENIMKGQIHFAEQIWGKYDKFAKDLICRLLKPRNQRLNASQACKNLWFGKNCRIVDLTKSEIQAQQCESDEEEKLNTEDNFEIQRFNTQSVQISSKGKKNHNEKPYSQDLRKWITDNKDDNIVIEMNSESQDSHELPNRKQSK